MKLSWPLAHLSPPEVCIDEVESRLFRSARTRGTLFLILLILVLSAALAEGQALFSNYTVVELGANHRVLQKLATITNGTSITLRTNTIVHVASGMNRWAGQWVNATPTLIATNGSVLAVGARYSASFAGNANTLGACTVFLPGTGQTLSSHVVGVVYQDLVQGTNLFVATTRDSTAQTPAHGARLRGLLSRPSKQISPPMAGSVANTQIRSRCATAMTL